MPDTISICARKGGVGKTFLSACLAAHLAELQKARVLLIDCDGQDSLSSYFMKPGEFDKLERQQTTTAFFDDRLRVESGQMIHETHTPGLYIVPGNDSLTYYNHTDIPERPEHQRNAIRDFLGRVGHNFRFVLIDTGPQLRTLPNWAALMASDQVICPVVPEKFAARAIAPLQRFIAAAKTQNEGLNLLGFVVNQVDNRWGLHAANQERLAAHHKDLVFNQTIPRLIDYAAAIENGQPITKYGATRNAAKITRNLTLEIFQRIANQKQRAAGNNKDGQEAA